jgi:hypothetical protein
MAITMVESGLIKNVSPVILAEPYMEDYVGKGELTDYKLHFFSGECKAIMVGKNRFGEKGLEDDFYDPDWKHFNFFSRIQPEHITINRKAFPARGNDPNWEGFSKGLSFC